MSPGRRRADHRDALLEDAVRLPHLFHAHEVAIVRVAVLADGNVELEIGIALVRLRAAEVPLHAGSAQRRAGDAPVDRIFGREHADADRAPLPDAIVGQQRLVLVDGGVELVAERSRRPRASAAAGRRACRRCACSSASAARRSTPRTGRGPARARGSSRRTASSRRCRSRAWPATAGATRCAAARTASRA